VMENILFPPSLTPCVRRERFTPSSLNPDFANGGRFQWAGMAVKKLERQMVSGLSILTLSAATAALGQGSVGNGTFQDLDFESPSGTPVQGSSFVSLASLFPGWTGLLGPYVTTQAAYNGQSTGGDIISLVGPPSGQIFPPLDGKYSALLEGGIIPFEPPVSASASLSQTGLVPDGAQSLQMKILPIGNSTGFAVSLGGQNIPMVPLSSTPAYTLYAGSIVGFAGKSENLTISASAPPILGNENWVEFDDITFSSQLVPEPSTAALEMAGLGLGLLLHRRQRAGEPN